MCTCSSHGVLEGKDKTVAASIFPMEMCRRIAAAIAMVIKEKHRENADVGGQRGRPQKYSRFIEYNCIACRRGLHKHDLLHSRRDEPPSVCKYSDVAPMQITCPACVARLAGDHPNHTHDESCRSPSVRAAGRRRRGGDVRETCTASTWGQTSAIGSRIRGREKQTSMSPS